MGNDLPLGLHGKAVDYVLAARGTHQLYSPRSFSLARAALFRLQARQLLLGEDCTEIQRMLINSLNLDVADLRMLDHISQITHLCAKLKHLESGWFETSRGDVIENAARLLEDFDGLAVSIDEWTSAVDAELKPTILSSQVATWIQHVSTSNEENPMRAFQCPRMEWHRDTVVTFLWSFYAAAQLVLRDRVLRILNLTLQVSPTTTPLQQGRMEAETIKIDMLSASIIRLFPALMGFNSASSTGLSPQRKPSQINSLGRFLGIFAMLVIKHVPTTPESHKLCVERVLKWMRTYDQLNGTQSVSY
nr:hypothetical protein CFP56_09590 [Quercus suber]